MRQQNEKTWILTLAPEKQYPRRSDSVILLTLNSEESAENVSEKVEIFLTDICTGNGGSAGSLASSVTME
jgi:hypothetical protein